MESPHVRKRDDPPFCQTWGGAVILTGVIRAAGLFTTVAFLALVKDEDTKLSVFLTVGRMYWAIILLFWLWFLVFRLLRSGHEVHPRQAATRSR